MKLFLLLFLSAYTFILHATTQGTFEYNQKTFSYYISTSQVVRISFQGSESESSDFYKKNLQECTGLSDPEQTHTWSTAKGIVEEKDKSILISPLQPITESFILHVVHGAYGSNIGEKLLVRYTGGSAEIDLKENGCSSAYIPVADGLTINQLTFIPPYPQKPNNGDERLIAIALKEVIIICKNCEGLTITEVIHQQTHEKKSSGKRLEGFARKSGKDAEKIGQGIRDFFQKI